MLTSKQKVRHGVLDAYLRRSGTPCQDNSKPKRFGQSTTVQHIQPRMGSIVTGLHRRQLSDAAKDELVPGALACGIDQSKSNIPMKPPTSKLPSRRIRHPDVTALEDRQA